MEHPLRKFRVLKGLSIEKMAKELSVSTATVSRIENGKQNIPLELIRKIRSTIGDAMEFTDGDLLAGAAQPTEMRSAAE